LNVGEDGVGAEWDFRLHPGRVSLQESSRDHTSPEAGSGNLMASAEARLSPISTGTELSNNGIQIAEDFWPSTYWLVRVGSADDWGRLRDVAVFRSTGAETARIAVPPVDRIAGPRAHWRVPLTAATYLTDADALSTALGLAIADTLRTVCG